MIYIIIGNVGLVVMMIVIYFRYSKFRISSGLEISDLHKKLDKEAAEKREIEVKFYKDSNEKIEALLREVNSLRQDKESEVKLRLEAEKQIEIALQKTEEVQKRMQDWRAIQDAVMKDSKDAIVKLGNDLFKKMNDSYKIEVETTRNLIGRAAQATAGVSKPPLEKKVATKKTEAAVKEDHDHHHALEIDSPPSPSSESIVKKLTSDLDEIMKANGHLVNKNYFLPSNFDPEKSKLLLCEVAYIGADKLYIMDFKASRYLDEYNHFKVKNKAEAEDALKHKLDKYLAYLGNKKYHDSILKALSATNAKFAGETIVVVLPSKEDVATIKQLHYHEQFHKFNFEIVDFDEASDLVL